MIVDCRMGSGAPDKQKGWDNSRHEEGADLAGLPATRQPKEQKDRVHDKIDLKGGDSVLVRWGKATGKKRHR